MRQGVETSVIFFFRRFQLKDAGYFRCGSGNDCCLKSPAHSRPEITDEVTERLLSETGADDENRLDARGAFLRD
jgi:hypothetical protein